MAIELQVFLLVRVAVNAPLKWVTQTRTCIYTRLNDMWMQLYWTTQHLITQLPEVSAGKSL